MSFKNILGDFYLNLDIPKDLPDGVGILNPYQNKETQVLTNAFFKKYYSDENPRTMLIGINPGRFGGGITGIGFTDPINLQDKCGIENHLEKKHELSSIFMYQMIETMGGPKSFFGKYLFSSVSPLGFVKDGKNLNYYDIPELKKNLEEFMADSLKQQIDLGADKKIAYSIGMGENVKYIRYINKKYNLFDKVKVLPHPRWIMQYRRKRVDEFVMVYLKELK